MPKQLSLKGFLPKPLNHSDQLEENTKQAFNVCFSLLKNCWLAYKKNDFENLEKYIEQFEHSATRLFFHVKATVNVKKQLANQKNGPIDDGEDLM